MKPAFRYHSCWSQTRLSSIGQYLKSVAITIFGKHSGSNGFINYVTVAMLSYTLFLWQFGGQRVYCLCLFDEGLISSLVFVSSKAASMSHHNCLSEYILKPTTMAVAQEVEASIYWVGMLVGLRLHVEESLGKIFNPKLLPMAHPSVCECSGE